MGSIYRALCQWHVPAAPLFCGLPWGYVLREICSFVKGLSGFRIRESQKSKRSPKFEWIHLLKMNCKTLKYSELAIVQMFRRNITTFEVKQVIESGQIIKMYPEDRPYPSWLIL